MIADVLISKRTSTKTTVPGAVISGTGGTSLNDSTQSILCSGTDCS